MGSLIASARETLKHCCRTGHRLRGRQCRRDPADPARHRAPHPAYGRDRATTLALARYVAYNVAATTASIPAGRLGDRLGPTGAGNVLAAGVLLFAVAYLVFAIAGTTVPALAPGFIAAGPAIGCVETAEHSAVAALAPPDLRGSAFGLLATVQSLGNLAASGIAGLLWTLASPTAAFTYLFAWMLIALTGLLFTYISL